jgi:branched-chain amino acid transport system substrate-binding protein
MVGAIERAGSLDPDKIAKELEKTNMVGATGRIHFQDHQYVFGDDPKVDAISAVYQWKKGGKRVPIYPDSIAEGVIEKPASMK